MLKPVVTYEYHENAGEGDANQVVGDPFHSDDYFSFTTLHTAARLISRRV